MRRFLTLLGCALLLGACSEAPEPVSTEQASSSQSVQPVAVSEPAAPTSSSEGVADAMSAAENPVIPKYNYDLLFRKILGGDASLAEMRQALTDTDVAGLTNSVHALYAMRWHRGGFNLARDLWRLDKRKYPELTWPLIEKPPVRIAVASTLVRIEGLAAAEQVAYLRQHKDDKDPFNRAQVAVALGFNGDREDVEYLVSAVKNDVPYVGQSAITALGLMATGKAKNALVALEAEFRNDPRGNVIREVLTKAYAWNPAAAAN